jgi:hypothetical protein
VTVRGLLLALALLTALPVDAAHGRCYSIWHYPWAQRCGVTFARHVTSRPSRPVTLQSAPLRWSDSGAGGADDIPLPLLTRSDCMGGEADELTRARLLLRAALEVLR